MSDSSLKSDVPALRVRAGNAAECNPESDYVLYWMIAFRRTRWNYSLQRAVDWARHLNKPLVILEALRCDYRWASDRLHYFIIQGMRDNAAELEGKPVLYYPYLEPVQGAGRGLLRNLAIRACVVVSDDFPSFFLPRMVKAAALKIPVRFELVDSNGILPMRGGEGLFQGPRFPPLFTEEPPAAFNGVSQTQPLVTSATAYAQGTSH